MQNHTQIDLARRSSILLAFGLFFMTRYAPSKFWLLAHLKSEHKKKIQRGWKHIPSKIPLLEEKRKAKRSPSVTGKQHHAFRRLVLPDARRFWATFPGHGCEQDVYRMDFSSSCVRGMSNPITHITRIFLATERSRRRRKREKQKLAPYKIYSLCHS
jgi:hypothetical protein